MALLMAAAVALAACEAAVPAVPPQAAAFQYGFEKVGAWNQLVLAPAGRPPMYTAMNYPDGKVNPEFSMMVSCDKSKSSFTVLVFANRVVGNAVLDRSRPTVRVSYKVDATPPRTEDWPASGTAASPPDAVAFARGLVGRRTMTLRVQDPSAAVLGNFDLDGVDKVVATAFDACGIPR